MVLRIPANIAEPKRSAAEMWSAAECPRQGLCTLITRSTLSAGHTHARRGCLVAPSTYPKLTPSPIHPSLLSGGRLGGG